MKNHQQENVGSHQKMIPHVQGQRRSPNKMGLTLNIQKTKIMASGPITSWQIDGETMETVTDFIFMGSKITADGDCSHEIKRHLLFERKTRTSPDSIVKSRCITLLTKVHIVISSSHVCTLDYINKLSTEEWMLLNCSVGEDS